MRIKFPDSLTGGEPLGELPVKNLATATNRAVLALQMQTGFTVGEIRQKAKHLHSYALEFLTLHDALHDAGLPPVTWDQILDLTGADTEWIPEPGDDAAAPKEAAPGEDRGATPAADARATPRKKAPASKPQTSGSRRKSANASHDS